MANFFEKLKRGMGIEIPTEEKIETPKESKLPTGQEKERPRKARIKKIGYPPSECKEKLIELEVKEPSKTVVPIEPSLEKKTPEKIEEKPKVKTPAGVKTTEFKETWLEPVGQLAVDVYQTETELVIQSAIAGVKSEDLDISLEGDVITISGERKRPFEEKGDYFSQECYWGKFSRQIILPVEVDPNKIEATLKDGILTIKTIKLQKEKKRKIAVKE